MRPRMTTLEGVFERRTGRDLPSRQAVWMALLSLQGQQSRCSSLPNRSERMAGCILRHPLKTGEVARMSQQRRAWGRRGQGSLPIWCSEAWSLGRMTAVEGTLTLRKWSAEREMKPAAPGIEWRYYGSPCKRDTARVPSLHCCGGVSCGMERLTNRFSVRSPHGSSAV